MQFWEMGWKTLFDNIGPLTLEDFSKTVTIRGEPHTIVEAINRQLTHYAMRVGQIVFLAKHLTSDGSENSERSTSSVCRIQQVSRRKAGSRRDKNRSKRRRERICAKKRSGITDNG